MSSLARPLVLEYRVQPPFANRASPCPAVPTQSASSRSTSRQEMSLTGAATVEIFPSRSENKPPPSVPIHRFPAASSASARTALGGSPSPVEKNFHACPS